MRFRALSASSRVEIVFDDGGMNLLSSDALAELHALVQQPATGNQQLLVFRSARPNLFAAGADMAEMQRFTARDAEEFSRQGQELFATIEKLPLLTVALIDGDCFGGALDLAMAFDLRLATPRSRFAHPGAKLGIITGFGGTSRWRSIVVPATARRLFLGNEMFSAAQALAGGLVDRVADGFEGELQRLEQLDPKMVRIARELARHAGRLSQSQLVEIAQLLAKLQ